VSTIETGLDIAIERLEYLHDVPVDRVRQGQRRARRCATS
jgi:hypothetical protein